MISEEYNQVNEALADLSENEFSSITQIVEEVNAVLEDNGFRPFFEPDHFDLNEDGVAIALLDLLDEDDQSSSDYLFVSIEESDEGKYEAYVTFTNDEELDALEEEAQSTYNKQSSPEQIPDKNKYVSVVLNRRLRNRKTTDES